MSETYEVGTVVRIVNDFIDFTGLVCLVLQSDESRLDYRLLKPLVPRPDNLGFQPFTWACAYMEPVDSDEARNFLLAYELTQ